MFSEDLINKVRDIYRENKNYRQTARRLNMNHQTVVYMVKNKYERIKKKRGPKRLINDREKTKIKKEVRRLKDENSKVTAARIKENCSIDASIRTVRRELARFGFGYGNVTKKLPLAKVQKTRRIELARKWINENLISKKIVFSD